MTVSVVVSRPDGQPVTGLSRTDFTLLDAGQPRAIADFRSENAPVSIAVLFDTSGSMGVAPKLSAARVAVARLASWLVPASDHVALFTFDSELHELQPFTATPADVMHQLDAVKPYGTTALYDAIVETGHRLVTEGGPRRAVVVVTDGVDNRSRLSASDASGIASAIDVPVYVLVILPRVARADTETTLCDEAAPAPRAPLAALARWTGGALFLTSASDEASAATRRIVTELRHQYLMTFEPSTPAGWHPLTIRARDANLVVRARSGYVAGAHAGSQH